MLRAFPQAPKSPSPASTLALAGKTLREAEASWWQLNPPATTLRGLYGGKLVQLNKGDGFTLTRYALTPGVFVTGKVSFGDIGPPATYKGTVKVFGPRAIAGTLRLGKNSVSGKPSRAGNTNRILAVLG